MKIVEYAYFLYKYTIKLEENICEISSLGKKLRDSAMPLEG
jgi:hypothetical protein